jgi:predicted MFS family arabinose efflux permease
MVAALLLVRFFDEMASFVPTGTLESFRVDLGLTYAQAGAVLTAIAPGGFVGNAAAIAADFTSRRLIVVLGALGYAASMLTFAVADSFLVLLVAGFLVGVASTAMVDVSEVALADVAGDRLRPLLARGNLLSYVGDLLGPLILVGVAAAGFSWRAAFVVAAVLLVAYAAVLAMHPLPGAEPEPDGPTPRGMIGQVLRDPQVWLLALLSILLNPLDETIFAFGIAYLGDARGIELSVAALAVGAADIGGIVALALVIRRLEGRDDDRILVACGLGLAVSVGVFVVAPSLLVALPLLALGAGVAMAWTVLQHRELTLRPGQAGTTGAVISTIASVEYLAPVAIGALVDRVGLRTGMLAFVALPVAFAALASWSIHLSRARHPYREDDAGGPRDHSDGG